MTDRPTTNQTAASRLSALDPLLLGFAAFMAWGTCRPWAEGRFVAYAGPSIVSTMSYALFLVAFALLSNRRHGRLSSPRIVLVAGVCLSSTPIIKLLLSIYVPGTLPVLTVALTLIERFAYALTLLLWCEQIASRPQKIGWPVFAAAFVAEPLSHFIVISVPLAVAVCAVYLLPFASTALLYVYVRNAMMIDRKPEGFASAAQTNGELPPCRFPWKPALLMAAFSFAYYMLLHLLGGSSSVGMLGNLCMAGIMLVSLLVWFDRFGLKTLYKLSPVLMVAALLCLSQCLVDLSNLVQFLASAGFTGFTLFMYFVLHNISYRYGIRPIWLFGIVEGMSVFFHMVGSFVGNYLVVMTSSPEMASQSDAFISVVANVAALLLVLLGFVFYSEHDLCTTWGVASSCPPPDEQTAAVTSLPVLTSDACEELAWQCSKMAFQYGLTKREEEVLFLLVQDKSTADIETALFISKNTAKGHLRNLYAKLGVHTREEAVELTRSLKVSQAHR